MPTTRGLVEKPIDKKYVLNNFFSDKKKDYLYKAKIDIYNKKLGGILIIKKIGKEHHRIVFTTEIGNKIFDFEIISDDFKVNYMLDELNKNMVLNTLQSNFNILVKQHISVEKQLNSAKEIIFKTSYDDNFDLYYFYLKEDKKLFKIIKASKKKEKVIFDFLETRNNVGTKIAIIHQNIQLKIHLNYIGN
ncbi:MAG: hypothetical protein HF967_07310 [Methanosarcinales archaeon]|nr:hypothetical protein [Methanosarcinales archaeon]